MDSLFPALMIVMFIVLLGIVLHSEKKPDEWKVRMTFDLKKQKDVEAYTKVMQLLNGIGWIGESKDEI